MRKIAAFLTALFMFCAAVISLHFVSGRIIDTNNSAFGTWINSKKDLSYAAVKNNLEEDTLLMLGSSEFNHGKSSKYHPKEIFEEAGMNVMCIGAAKNQCLSHAITMGAVGSDLKSKKAVLILSPTWFSKDGVDGSGFSARFSESQFEALLKNDSLSPELKKKISDRVTELLSVSPGMQEDALRDVRVLSENEKSLKDRLLYAFNRWTENERERVSVGMMWKLAGGENHRTYAKARSGACPDWNGLAAEADSEFFEKSDNEFFMKNSAYNGKIKPIMSSKKGAYADRSWAASPEYDDLKLFLDVCAEEDVDVMLVLLPVNGYWYDYTGFKESSRRELEENIEDIAKQYGAELCDFFGEAYNKGFLEDAVHPAGKGWVRINEKVYEFYNKDKKAV